MPASLKAERGRAVDAMTDAQVKERWEALAAERYRGAIEEISKVVTDGPEKRGWRPSPMPTRR